MANEQTIKMEPLYENEPMNQEELLLGGNQVGATTGVSDLLVLGSVAAFLAKKLRRAGYAIRNLKDVYPMAATYIKDYAAKYRGGGKPPESHIIHNSIKDLKIQKTDLDEMIKKWDIPGITDPSLGTRGTKLDKQFLELIHPGKGKPLELAGKGKLPKIPPLKSPLERHPSEVAAWERRLLDLKDELNVDIPMGTRVPRGVLKRDPLDQQSAYKLLELYNLEKSWQDQTPDIPKIGETIDGVREGILNNDTWDRMKDILNSMRGDYSDTEKIPFTDYDGPMSRYRDPGPFKKDMDALRRILGLQLADTTRQEEVPDTTRWEMPREDTMMEEALDEPDIRGGYPPGEMKIPRGYPRGVIPSNSDLIPADVKRAFLEDEGLF